MLTTKPNQNRQLFSSAVQNSLVQTDQNMIIQNGNRTANAEPPCAASADIELSTTPTGCDAMADLDALRPEVQEAVDAFDIGARMGMTFGNKGWNIIRAELLRLADENKRMRGIIETLDIEGHRRAEKAEAELAALRAKIEGAPLTTFRRAMLGTPHAWVEEKFACPEWIGKCVRLVVEE